jgi:TRAP transporter TAXI family solute receptor
MKTTIYATACALALATTAAHAQLLTISTTNPGGLAHSIGSAIAKTVTDAAGVRTVVVPAGGSPMPPVVGGEADCGVNTAYDLAYYVNGSNYYSDEGKHENLRMVGAVLPSLVAMYVREDSEVQSIADLEGMRIPGGLNAQLAIGEIYETYLKLAGLTREDVESIPTQSIVQGADDFSSGRNDAFVFSVGTAKVLEVDSSVGGLRALTVEATDESRTKLRENLPGAYFTELTPEQAPQIVEPTNVITFDLVLFCSDSVPEETVYEITKAVAENKEMLAQSFKAMNRFQPEAMAPAIEGVEYHPGAIRFHEEAGIWPPKE